MLCEQNLRQYLIAAFDLNHRKHLHCNKKNTFLQILLYISLKTVEKVWNMFKVNNKDTRTMSLEFFFSKANQWLKEFKVMKSHPQLYLEYFDIYLRYSTVSFHSQKLN